MKKTFYTVTTTFPGADRPTTLYFDAKSKALHYLHNYCDNGEISRATITYSRKLDYSDCCTYNELMHFEYEL